MRHMIVGLSLVTLFLGCKSTKGSQDASSVKDFDQVLTLTPNKALCRDLSVYEIAKIGNSDSYQVRAPDGTTTTVVESELLKTVCPAPGTVQSSRLLEQGKYISITDESGFKNRCDMSVLSFESNGQLVSANASASSLEIDGPCVGALNVYSFTCMQTNGTASCKGKSLANIAIDLSDVRRFSFQRTFQGSTHTFVNIDAPTAPLGGQAPIQNGTYKPNGNI